MASQPNSTPTGKPGRGPALKKRRRENDSRAASDDVKDTTRGDDREAADREREVPCTKCQTASDAHDASKLSTALALIAIAKAGAEGDSLPRALTVWFGTGRGWNPVDTTWSSDEPLDARDNLGPRGAIAVITQGLYEWDHLVTSREVNTSYLLATLRINGELVLGTLATYADKSAFQDRMQSRLWGLCAAPDLELGNLKAQNILEDLSGRTVRELPSSHTVTGVLENATVKAAVDKVLTSRLGDASLFDVKFKALHMYGKGGKYKRHAEPQRPGLVGTLVVVPGALVVPWQYKTAYSGGDVVAWGDRRWHRLEAADRTCVYFIPAGVEHRLATVTRGIRVSITFDVLYIGDRHSGDSSATAASTAAAAAPVTSTGCAAGAGSGAGAGATSEGAASASSITALDAAQPTGVDILRSLARPHHEKYMHRVHSIVYHPDTLDAPPPVLLFPLQVRYSIARIHAASRPGVALSDAGLCGSDKTLLELCVASPRLHCCLSPVVLTSSLQLTPKPVYDGDCYDWNLQDAECTQTMRLQCASRALFQHAGFLEYVITHKKAQLKAPTFGDDGPDEWMCGAALVLSTGHDAAVDEYGDASPGIWNKVHLRLVLCVTSSTNPLLDAWRKDGSS